MTLPGNSFSGLVGGGWPCLEQCPPIAGRLHCALCTPCTRSARLPQVLTAPPTCTALIEFCPTPHAASTTQSSPRPSCPSNRHHKSARASTISLPLPILLLRGALYRQDDCHVRINSSQLLLCSWKLPLRRHRDTVTAWLTWALRSRHTVKASITSILISPRRAASADLRKTVSVGSHRPAATPSPSITLTSAPRNGARPQGATRFVSCSATRASSSLMVSHKTTTTALPRCSRTGTAPLWKARNMPFVAGTGAKPSSQRQSSPSTCKTNRRSSCHIQKSETPT